MSKHEYKDCDGCNRKFEASKYRCEDCGKYTVCENYKCHYCMYCEEYKENHGK